jgi:hypothetical protein
MGQPVSRGGDNQVTWTSPFFLNCKLGILQYVLLKVITAVASMILELNGFFHEGRFEYDDAYPYIMFIANLSQCWALYCLAFFYFATKNELQHIRPVGKFLSVKALIFFTWWQAVGISILDSMNMIPDNGQEWTSEDVGKGIQDYLICIEMFIGAIVHQYVFHHNDYSSGDVTYKSVHSTRRRRVGRRHGRQSDGFALLPGNKNLSDASLHSSDENNFHSEDELLADDDCGTGLDFEMMNTPKQGHINTPPTIMEALIQSSVPSDVMGDTKRVFKGSFKTHKKTLLHHATTADSNSLFTSRSHSSGNAKQRLPMIPSSSFENDPSSSTSSSRRKDSQDKHDHDV